MAERLNAWARIARRQRTRGGADPVASFAALVMLGAVAAINSTVWGIVQK